MRWPARGNKETPQKWPLPYLIELCATSHTSVIMETLPGGKLVALETGSFGTVLAPVGGPTWDIKYDIFDSLAPVVPNPIRIKLRCDNKNPPDFFKNDAVMIVSEKFRRVVEPYIKNTEFLPIHAETTPRRNARSIGLGPIREDLFWMNCWNRCDLANLDKSIFTPGDSKYRSARYANSPNIMYTWDLLDVCAPEGTGGLFGIKGIGGGQRFITPELHDIILQSGLNVRFSPVPLDKRSRPEINDLQFQYLQAVRKPLAST